MPCALAHSRTSVVFSPPAGPRRLPRAGLRALPPTRRAASKYRASTSRNSLACPAFRSISYSVPSSPKRTVPSAVLPSRSSMNRVCTSEPRPPGSSHWLSAHQCMQFSQASAQPTGTLSDASDLRPSESPSRAALQRSDRLQRAACRSYVAGPAGPGRTRMATHSGLYHATRNVRSSLYQVNIWMH